MGFFDSYFKVEVTYDSIKKTYTILGPLRLETANKKYPKVFSNVFESILPNKVIFHQVFLPEVIALFNYIINNNNVNANVNLLKNSLEELERLVNERTLSKKNKYELDISMLDNIIDKKPLPHMINIYQKYGNYKATTGNRGLLLDAAAGTSKAQRNSMLIRIPNGWKPIGEINVGDSVMTYDGSYTKVTGVYPQGKKQLYRIYFSDGRSTDCCEDHLWFVYWPKSNIFNRTKFGYEGTVKLNDNDLYRGNVLDTKTIKAILDSRNERDFYNGTKYLYIPLTEPEKNKPKEYFIDPYILGVILGDGSITSGSINIHCSDNSVMERVNSKLRKGYKIVKHWHKNASIPTYTIIRDSNVFTKRGLNEYTLELKRLNLFGCSSLTKFIPSEYLNGSIEQRWELVRGLMDTDGSVGITKGRNGTSVMANGLLNSGCISYATSSKMMAEGFQLLIRSLGDICKLRLDTPYYTYKGQKLKGNISYALSIRAKKPTMYFTRQALRRERLRDTTQYSAGFKLRIEKIEKIDIDECTCIRVDHPHHLYVTNDYIVSHNTSMSLSIAEMLKAKKVVVITPSNALYKVWVKSIVGYNGDKSEYKNPKANTVWTSRDNTGYKDERFVIVHYEALETLLSIINKVADKETVVIVDESHNFADTKSKRTNLLVDIVDRSMSNHILLLSGTPIKSYSTEIINIARLIDIEIRGDILNRLLNIYKSPVSFFQPLLIERYQNLSFKVEKKEVNLKPVTKIYVPIKLKNGNDYTLDTIKQNMQKYINERLTFIGKHLPNYEKAYTSFLEQIINAGWEKKSKYTLKEYQKLFTYIQDMSNKRMLRLIPKEIELCNKIEKEMSMFLLPQYRTDWHETKTILKYPILKIQGECLGKIVMGARIACHKDIARELDYIELLSSTTKKTIIFSNYTEVCDEAKSRVEGLKLKPIYVYGNKTKDLTKEVDTFTKDKKRNPMITTYKSLSTAVPLTVANVIIALDLPFRMYIFEQAVSRVWRIGQDQEVLVYIPTLDTGDKPNINQRNFDIISFFNNAVEEMTGYQSSLTVDETIKAMATQFFLNLESMSAVHDLMHTDFNYDAYIQHNYNKKMLYW